MSIEETLNNFIKDIKDTLKDKNIELTTCEEEIIRESYMTGFKQCERWSWRD